MKKTWYYNQNLKPCGPFTLQEMREKVHRGEVGPLDLVCNEDEGQWKPACECREFEKGLFPAAQGVNPEVSGGLIDEKIWILLSPTAESGGSMQEGPFSTSELMERLGKDQLSPYRYVWKNGLSGWCMIKDRLEFSAAITSERLANHIG